MAAMLQDFIRELETFQAEFARRKGNLGAILAFIGAFPAEASEITKFRRDESGLLTARDLVRVRAKTENKGVHAVLEKYEEKCFTKMPRGRPGRRALSDFEKLKIALLYRVLIGYKKQPVKHTKAKRLLAEQFGIGLRHVSEVLAETSKGLPTDERVSALLNILE